MSAIKFYPFTCQLKVKIEGILPVGGNLRSIEYWCLTKRTKMVLHVSIIIATCFAWVKKLKYGISNNLSLLYFTPCKRHHGQDLSKWCHNCYCYTNLKLPVIICHCHLYLIIYLVLPHNAFSTTAIISPPSLCPRLFKWYLRKLCLAPNA